MVLQILSRLFVITKIRCTFCVSHFHIFRFYPHLPLPSGYAFFISRHTKTAFLFDQFLYFLFAPIKNPGFFFLGKLKWPALASHFIKDIHIDITTPGKWVMGFVLSFCERHFSFCCVFCCFIFRIRCFSFFGFLYFFFIYCLCRKYPLFIFYDYCSHVNINRICISICFVFFYLLK